MTGPTGVTGATGATGPASTTIIGGGGTHSEAIKGGGNYIGLFMDNSSTTEANVQQVMPVAGTLDNFNVRLDEGPGSGGDEYTFTIRLNAGSTTLSCSILNAATSCTHTGAVPVTAGQLFSILAAPKNNPSNSPSVRWTATFTPGP